MVVAVVIVVVEAGVVFVLSVTRQVRVRASVVVAAVISLVG